MKLFRGLVVKYLSFVQLLCCLLDLLVFVFDAIVYILDLPFLLIELILHLLTSLVESFDPANPGLLVFPQSSQVLLHDRYLDIELGYPLLLLSDVLKHVLLLSLHSINDRLLVVLDLFHGE